MYRLYPPPPKKKKMPSDFQHQYLTNCELVWICFRILKLYCFARYVISPFHPGFDWREIHTLYTMNKELHTPFDWFDMLMYLQNLNGRDLWHTLHTQKSLFLRDYWTKSDGVFAEMEIIGCNFESCWWTSDIYFYFYLFLFFLGGGVDKRYILTSLGKVLWISSLIFIYLLII